jgi:hypothetical protein
MRIMTEDPELASTRWQDVNAGFYLVWFDKNHQQQVAGLLEQRGLRLPCGVQAFSVEPIVLIL